MGYDIPFTKLAASGNDFICVDNRDGRFDEITMNDARLARFARSLCARRTGVGADGLIFACPPEAEEFADINARFLEADGSEAELCGNGTACFTHWVLSNGWVRNDEIRILTSAGVVRGCRAGGSYIRVCIPLPEDIRRDLSIDTGLQHWDCDFAVTGVPHLVAYVPDVEAVDVEESGRALRHHAAFRPRGVNANFVEVRQVGELAVRTFEFGVEGETLGCGTGSATAAVLAAVRFGWPEEYLAGQRPVIVQARSGDRLRVWVTVDEDLIVTDLCLDSPVRTIYTASLHADVAEPAMSAELESDGWSRPCRP